MLNNIQQRQEKDMYFGWTQYCQDSETGEWLLMLSLSVIDTGRHGSPKRTTRVGALFMTRCTNQWYIQSTGCKLQGKYHCLNRMISNNLQGLKWFVSINSESKIKDFVTNLEVTVNLNLFAQSSVVWNVKKWCCHVMTNFVCNYNHKKVWHLMTFFIFTYLSNVTEVCCMPMMCDCWSWFFEIIAN